MEQPITPPPTTTASAEPRLMLLDATDWRRLLIVTLLRRRWPASEPGQNRFEDRQCVEHVLGSDQQVPQRLEFLPAAGVGYVPQPRSESGLGRRASPDRSPTVEISIRTPVAGFQLSSGEPLRFEDHMTGVKQIPIVVQHPVLRLHPLVKGWWSDTESGCGRSRFRCRGGRPTRPCDRTRLARRGPCRTQSCR